MTDKRAQFFFLAALVCFLLVPVAQAAYRELTLAVGVTYVLLAVASWLDHRSRH
jgi:hypothetical protein